MLGCKDRHKSFSRDSSIPKWSAPGGALLQAFWPVTLEVPKALLPLVNVPMIDYSLEWLAASKVEEVSLMPPIVPQSNTWRYHSARGTAGWRALHTRTSPPLELRLWIGWRWKFLGGGA